MSFKVVECFLGAHSEFSFSQTYGLISSDVLLHVTSPCNSLRVSLRSIIFLRSLGQNVTHPEVSVDDPLDEDRLRGEKFARPRTLWEGSCRVTVTISFS